MAANKRITGRVNTFILSVMTRLGIPTKGLGFDFIKNTGWVGAGTLIESVCSYIIIILITRHLGVDGLGQYTFLTSFSILFFILADFGLSNLLVKEVSKNEEGATHYLSKIFSLKIFLGLLVFVIYFFVLFFLNKPDLFLPLVIFGFIALFNQLFRFPKSIFSIKQKGKILSIVNLTYKFIILLAAIFILPLFHSLLLFVLFMLFAAVLRLIISLLIGWGYFSFRFIFSFYGLLPFLKRSFPFILAGLFIIIYSKIDSVMLSFMKDFVVVGWYNAGYNFVQLLTFFPTIFLTFGFSLFAKYSKNNRILKSLFQNIYYFVSLFVIPLIAGSWFFADKMISFIYGFSSSEAVLSLKILLLASVFVYTSNIFGLFIASVHKQQVFAKIAGFGALTNIVLNLILIPFYSLYGAAFATLFTYLFMSILMFLFINRNIFSFSFLRLFFVPFLVSSCIFLVSFLVRSLSLFSGIGVLVAAFLPLFILAIYFKKYLY